MREINNVSDADLQAMAALDKNCLDLHLFPPPKTFIQMDVEGPDGKKVESRKMRSQSWHRNAYNQIMTTMASVPIDLLGTGFGPGKLIMRAISGYAPASALINTVDYGKNIGAAGKNDLGIVVGYGGNAEDFNDFSLSACAPAASVVSAFPLSALTNTLKMAVQTIQVNSTGTRLAVVHNSSAPYLSLFRIPAGGHQVTQITLNGLSLAQYPTSAEWSPDGNFLALAYQNYTKIYSFDGATDTFNEVFSVYNSWPGYKAGHYKWSPDGKYLFATGNSSKMIRNNLDGTFTELAGVNIGFCSVPAWSPDSEYFIVTLTTAPYVKIYKNNYDDTFTEISTSFGLSVAGIYATPAWSSDGKYLTIPLQSSPYMYVIKKTGVDAFSLVSPSFGLSATVYSACFSKNDEYLLVSTGQPYGGVTLYKNNKDDSFTLIGSTQMFPGNTWAYVYDICRAGETDVLYCQHSSYDPYVTALSVGAGLSFTAQNQTTGKYDAQARKMQVVMSRVFNNNSAVDATIKELAIYTLGSQGTYMYCRDVLAEPLIVPPAYKLTVTYTMEMTFPA